MAKKITEERTTLTREELKTLAAVSNDVFLFSTFCYVIHPMRGKVLFKLYPYQRSVLYNFVAERFNIILKFRQAGITELLSMYCLWLAMYHPNKKINIISIKDITAKKVLKKIKFMYKNLPWYLQTPILNGRGGEYGSASLIEFNNGSFIESLPTSPEAGRSESLTLLVIDEAAMVRWASDVFAAALPTISTGGACIINSCITGNTKIITDKGLLRVRDICPKKFGYVDLSMVSNLRVLTHKGEWKRIIGSVNKGRLETWKIQTEYGTTLKCTPNHKLYTLNGWMTVKDIVEKGEQVILYKTGLSELLELPRVDSKGNQDIFNSYITKIGKGFTDLDSITTTMEEVKNGSMGNQFKLSKIKVLKKFKATIYDITVEDHHSYITYNYSRKRKNSQEYNFINKNTPRGIGGFYHSMWVDSIAQSNGFNPLRLYWNMHPERDQAWYDQMAAALGPRRTAQEIDGDFLGSGNTVFDLADIKAIEDCLDDYPVIEKRFNGQYRRYLNPEPESEYFIGADVATGRNTDYSSFTCMDKSGEEQVVFKGRLSVDKFGRLLGDTGQLFNWATIAPESNDVGLAVTSLLQTEGYPKLYYYQKILKKKGKSKPEMDQSPGWLTTNKNRSVIIEGLEKDIREENVIIKDPFFVQEAYTFIYDGLGRPVAMGKHKTNTDAVDMENEVYADDDIFGKAICNHIRKGKTNIIVQPR